LAGVVDEDIDRTKGEACVFERLGNGGRVTNVCDNMLKLVVDTGLVLAAAGRGVAAKGGHFRPVGQQPAGHCRADAARAAGDQSMLAGEKLRRLMVGGLFHACTSNWARATLRSNCSLPER
jgi:hypothetical protein